MAERLPSTASGKGLGEGVAVAVVLGREPGV